MNDLLVWFICPDESVFRPFVLLLCGVFPGIVPSSRENVLKADRFSRRF